VAAQRVVYLHVGGHKTGTTFLQHVLWHNREALRRNGFLYPGNRQASHIWACHDLRRSGFKSYRAPQVEGAWSRLVDEIRAFDGPAVIDQEMFSLANERQIRRALDDLSFADVRIVFTARDMARQLPAAWQEWIKNRDTITYADFLAAVRQDSDQSRRLRALHDVPAILAKWSANLPADSVTVVTVPPRGADPDILWQRFTQVLGLDPARYRTDIPGSNTSLGAAEATVIRRLNTALPDVPQPRYDRAVKFGLAPELSARGGARIELPQDAFEWACEQAEAAVAALRAADYVVVGDLEELIPTARPTGVDPDAVPADQQADAAIAGLAAVVRMPDPPNQGASEAEVRRLRSRLDEAESRLQEHADLPAGERIRRCAIELAAQVGWLNRAYRLYRRLRRRSSTRPGSRPA
jgi:hypothetical protein